MPTAATSTRVEKWTRDGQRVERMPFAGNSLDRAREIFQAEVRRRRGGRLYDPAALTRARSVAARLMGFKRRFWLSTALPPATTKSPPTSPQPSLLPSSPFGARQPDQLFRRHPGCR